MHSCADILANFGLTVSEPLWWDESPSNIRGEIIKNKLGLPNYRFVNFRDWLWYSPPIFFVVTFYLIYPFGGALHHLLKKKRERVLVCIHHSFYIIFLVIISIISKNNNKWTHQ